jgi:O-6-methylguanine DNA methyltransferase
MLRLIQPGETWSYAELALRLGRASATRAVGRANGRNNLALVIPCHRVIGVCAVTVEESGESSGYSNMNGSRCGRFLNPALLMRVSGNDWTMEPVRNTLYQRRITLTR